MIKRDKRVELDNKKITRMK